ncbi:hypothetical protein ACLOJK_040525 [Asimina triloba]
MHLRPNFFKKPLLQLLCRPHASPLPYAVFHPHQSYHAKEGASSMEKWGREGEMRDMRRKTRLRSVPLLLVSTSSSPIVGFVPENQTHRVSVLLVGIGDNEAAPAGRSSDLTLPFPLRSDFPTKMICLDRSRSDLQAVSDLPSC